MTILNNGTRNQYTATSGQTAFTYTFELFTDDDIVVYRGETLLAKTTDYTVTGVGNDNGGTITLVTAATAGDVYTIFRETTPERLTGYQNSGEFLAEEVNSDFERLWAVIQEQRTNQDRYLQVSTVTETPLPVILDDGVASNFLRWSSDARSVENVALSTLSPASVVATDYNTRVANYAALRLIDTDDFADGQVITVTDDGIFGNFVLRNSAAHGLTDNAGTRIVIDADWYAERRFSGPVMATWFECAGDSGTTDNSTKAQAAADYLAAIGGGDLHFTMDSAGGDYRFAVVKGTNDKYGFYVGSSNIRITADKGVRFRRQSSDISTYALSFPILLLGVPDDNNTQLTNLEVAGINFYGEDTRHSTNGSALMDGRQAIWVKNVDGCDIHHNKFENIDSGAIYVQRPSQFDYENSQYYNTTKSYNVNIKDNDFIAQPHSTNGRALLHAISARADDVTVTGNYFEWCDDALTASTTYDDYDDLETDTYTDTNLGASVKRAGKGYTISGNKFYNSSEHCLYLEAMGMTVGPNEVVVDNPTVCDTVQYQIRGRGVSISGGTMTGVARAGSINTGAMDVTWTGTVINSVGDSAGGIINIQSQGLTSYIDSRSDFFGSYKPMKNIRVDVPVSMPAAHQTNGVGIRLYTDTSDANFPRGQMINVNLDGTIIDNPKYGILNIANMGRNIKLDGTIMNGKPFTETGFGSQGSDDTSTNAAFLTDSTASFTTDQFVGWTIYNTTDNSSATVTSNTATTVLGTLSGGTDNDWDSGDNYILVPPMGSVAALAVDDSLTSALQSCTFRKNTIFGFEHILYDFGGAGSAGTIDPPYGCQQNKMDYIYRWDSDAFKEPVIENMFSNNTGVSFLDRAGWAGSASIQNSLYDGHNASSDRKNCILIVGAADVRAYYDDAGGFKAL